MYSIADNQQQKNDEWWKQIQKTVQKRQDMCKLQGIGYVYKLKENPYKYGNYKQFSENFSFRPKKDCVLAGTTRYSELDKKKRVYKNIKDKSACAEQGGVWRPLGTNRLNKYDQGVCWKTESDAACGDVIEEDITFLRGKVPKSEMEILKKKRQCESLSSDGQKLCAFRKTTQGYHDCFSKEIIDELEGVVIDPPKNMPANPTDEGFEQFLKKWYAGELTVDGAVVRAPRVLASTGVGCGSGSGSGDGDAENLVQLSREELAKLDPTIPVDSIKLIRAIGERQFKKYFDIWVDIKKSSKNFKLKFEEKMKMMWNWDRVKIYDEGKEEEIIVNAENIPTGKPSIAQSVVNMVMKNIAQKGSTARGLLALHSTGSGKTCTATGVMEAFWDSGRDIVFCTSLDALAANPPYKFHECAQHLFPRWKGMNVEQIAERFEMRGIKFMSFAKLANRLVKDNKEFVDLDNAVLIIDEVHNLFRPLPNQKAKHQAVEKELVDVARHKSLKMVILTATPGDNVVDAMKLLNMIRDPVVKPDLIKGPVGGDKEDVKRFMKDIRGLISYYDLSSDLSRFPKLEDSEPMKFAMSHKQFVKYLEAYNAVKKEWQDYDKLAAKNQLAKWWVGARRYANMLYTFEKGMKLTEFSSKLPALLENLVAQYENKEKAYVYSSFHENRGSSHGILMIAKQLEVLGWKPFTMADVKAFESGKLTPAKRYMIASQKEKNFDAFIRVYNSDDNRYGELISIMVATQNFNEGLDLKAVRHIHIFEPLLTIASDLQTLGRARRYCSHAALDKAKGEWTVKVWRYMSVFGDMADVGPTKAKRVTKKTKDAKAAAAADGFVADLPTMDKVKESIEELVERTAKEKYQQLFEITYAMREAAIDKGL